MELDLILIIQCAYITYLSDSSACWMSKPIDIFQQKYTLVPYLFVSSASMLILRNAVGIMLRLCVICRARVETLLTALSDNALE